MCCEKAFYRRHTLIISLIFLSVISSTLAAVSYREGIISDVAAVEKCETEHHSITLASFRWREIGGYFTISAFVIIAGISKIGFHRLHWLSSKIPESCLLILIGLLVSLIFYFTLEKETGEPDVCDTSFRFPAFTSEVFFFFLLPPIILDSAYSLHDRVFFSNIGTILLLAVVGTLFNAFAIGGSLYGVYKAGAIPNMEMKLFDTFVFSSLISAVDPVAVLAIFQELGVNTNLYFLIFGESLLNDGVTIVIYNTMSTFSKMDVISAGQYILAVLSFFIVSLVGVLLGVFYGFMTAIITKCTYHVRVVEPLAVLVLAYLSYVTAELFHFSGIICLITCGLIQAQYGFYNISKKSYTTIKYFIKMASTTSDSIIFLFLGMVLVNTNHEWNTAFVLWTLLFCFIYRFVGVFLLSFLANCYRKRPITVEEMLIMSYGGLRGAVAFSLANTLDEDMEPRNIYIFTTLIVVLFTVFVQGITIKPLVNILKIQRQSEHRKNLIEEISTTSMDHIMAGVEEIIGDHGDFYIKELLRYYDNRYLKKWFLHGRSDGKLTRLFEKITLSEHFAHLYGPRVLAESPEKRPSKTDFSVPLTAPSYDSDEFRIAADSKNRRVSSAVLSPIRRISRVFSAEQKPLDEQTLLKNAFDDNKYNKLHYTYNRTLNDDHDQELESHLERRSQAARRMSVLCASCGTPQSPTSAGDQEVLPEQGSSTIAKAHIGFKNLAQSLLAVEQYRRGLNSPDSNRFRTTIADQHMETMPEAETEDGSLTSVATHSEQEVSSNLGNSHNSNNRRNRDNTNNDNAEDIALTNIPNSTNF